MNSPNLLAVQVFWPLRTVKNCVILYSYPSLSLACFHFNPSFTTHSHFSKNLCTYCVLVTQDLPCKCDLALRHGHILSTQKFLDD